MTMQIDVDDDTKTDRTLLSEFFENTRDLLRKLVFGEFSDPPESYFIGPSLGAKIKQLHYSHWTIEVSRLATAIHDAKDEVLDRAGLWSSALRAKIQVAVEWAKRLGNAGGRIEIVQAVKPVLKQCQSIFSSAATAVGLGEAAKEYIDMVLNALSEDVAAPA